MSDAYILMTMVQISAFVMLIFGVCMYAVVMCMVFKEYIKINKEYKRLKGKEE